MARPAYRPNDAPIEYFFNQVEQGLKSRMYEIKTEADFVAAVHNIIANLQGVRATFEYCGY